MSTIYIFKCKNGHHFINSEICPYCNEQFEKKIEYQKGDCIACGVLCPGYAYGCNHPDPIDIKFPNGPISN